MIRRSFILAFILLWACSAHAQEPMVRIPYSCTYWVQPGDSLIKIAGDAFMQLYEINREALSQIDYSGRSNPNRIVAGTCLFIPEGTFLTERTAAAINAQQKSRTRALDAIKQARTRAVRLEGLGGSCPAGDKALERARGLTSEEPGYANLNYLDAFTLANRAAMYYEEAIRMTELNAKMRAIQNSLRVRKQAPGRVIERVVKTEPTFPWPWMAGLVVLAGILAGACFTLGRVRTRQKDILYVRERLNHHRERLTSLNA